MNVLGKKLTGLNDGQSKADDENFASELSKTISPKDVLNLTNITKDYLCGSQESKNNQLINANFKDLKYSNCYRHLRYRIYKVSHSGSEEWFCFIRDCKICRCFFTYNNDLK